MSTDTTSPGAALEALHAALTHLRSLAALPGADPRHGRAAEQVAAIIGDLTHQSEASFGIPLPPNPGAGPEGSRA